MEKVQSHSEPRYRNYVHLNSVETPVSFCYQHASVLLQYYAWDALTLHL